LQGHDSANSDKAQAARNAAREMALEALRTRDPRVMAQMGDVAANLASGSPAKARISQWAWPLAACLRETNCESMTDWMQLFCNIDTQCQPFETAVDIIRRQAGNDYDEVERRARELNEKIIDIIERLAQVQVTEGPDGDQTTEMEAPPVEAPREDGDESEAGELAEGDVDISFWRVPENFDLGEAKARLEELRAKIDALGPINMMALEELNEVEERYIFLSQQKADIEKAVSDTQAAIAEIRRRSRERFVEAFAAINANFSVMFQELFGGGRGEMRLIDESDILESGIEIIAQPPGKRLQNVLLLSGGEKAMAAIALVLAIFKYRPSPFCILDEVDAPLDEVNIGRFADKVTELSTNTQFVIITHSKRTMEAAKALYGVTMEDPGVSKLISVRLT